MPVLIKVSKNTIKDSKALGKYYVCRALPAPPPVPMTHLSNDRKTLIM